MTKTQLFAIITAMTATAHNALAYEIRLEPDAAKRRTVTIYRSQGPETAMLYLYAPTPWVIAGSAITAQDDNLWSGFNTTPNSPTHIYRMVNAHSSQQYVSIFGFLTQPGQGEGTPPWFRATVPSVDIDWEKHAGAGHESDEDAWTGVCPVTTNQNQRTKVIVRKPKDDRSLVAPSMTLECWPTDAARFLKEDGVTALWSGATVSDSDTPLTLYVDPQKTGTFQVTLSGPMDDAFNRPTDYLTGIVLKVDINRVLSDQLPNRECNLLPGQNPMYMGTRVDDRGYLQVEASVLPQQINNVGLVGVRHGTTILDSGPIQQPKTPLDFAPAGSRQQYEIVGGVDQNGDGQLQNTEICTTFSPNVLTLTQSDYNYSHGVLNTYATITWGVGSQLLEAFIDDTVPPNVVNTQTTITSGELTHPLGANWDYNCSATTRRYTYVEGTETSDDVEEDNHTITALKTTLNQHKTEVQNYFTQNPAVTEHTFGPWNWQAPNLQFDGLALQFAFGHVTISGTVSVTVRQSDLEVTHIVYGGSFDDIYDFAYNGAYPSEHGATVQAGFPTLGTGGRVFRDRVEFSRDTTDFDYDFN